MATARRRKGVARAAATISGTWPSQRRRSISSSSRIHSSAFFGVQRPLATSCAVSAGMTAIAASKRDCESWSTSSCSR